MFEIRDMDSLSTVEEVKKAIEVQIKEPIGELKVSLNKPNSRAQIMAIAKISENAANELLKTSRVTIGWVNCRVRRRTISYSTISSVLDTDTRQGTAKDRIAENTATNMVKQGT